MDVLKLIVAGGREFNDRVMLYDTMDYIVSNMPSSVHVEIVSGCARGADTLAIEYAKERGLVLHEFPADWKQYGKRAGYIRNRVMGDFADGLVAFWDGTSRGTKHMIEYMCELDKPIHVFRY